MGDKFLGVLYTLMGDRGAPAPLLVSSGLSKEEVNRIETTLRNYRGNGSYSDFNSWVVHQHPASGSRYSVSRRTWIVGDTVGSVDEVVEFLEKYHKNFQRVQ